MPQATFHTTRYDARVTYDYSQSVAGNYSDVSVSYIEIKDNDGYRYAVYGYGSISVNGSTTVSMSRYGCPFNLSSAYSGGGSNFPGWSASSVRVGHDASGGGAFSLSLVIDLADRSGGTDRGRVSGSVSIGLPTIPRVSGISASGVVLGQALGITISRAASSFTDTVVWSCGSVSGTIADKTASTSLQWVPPIDLAAQAPTGTTVTVKLTVTTYSGGTNIGSKSISVSCPIPETVVPTLSFTLSDKLGYPESYGGYIQNQSQLRVQTDAQGAYGSTIQSVAVSCGGITGFGADLTLQLPNEGTAKVTVVATDSRGRTATAEQEIAVLAYQNPTATVTDLYRCDETGNPQNDGSFAKLTFSYTVTGLDEKNVPVFRLLRRIRGAQDWTQTTISAEGYQFAAGVDYSYECRVEITDDFSVRESPTATLPVAFALMDFDRIHKAAGILQRANTPGVVSIGADTKHFGHRITDVGKPAALTDAATLDSVYPVGSIYMSVSETSPQTLFGGTWERIKDRFLLASGDSYAAGATGGETAHTLSVEEMPIHGHSFLVNIQHSDGGVTSGEALTSGLQVGGRRRYLDQTENSGGNQPHNNMPPYLAVYMWVRTG